MKAPSNARPAIARRTRSDRFLAALEPFIGDAPLPRPKPAAKPAAKPASVRVERKTSDTPWPERKSPAPSSMAETTRSTSRPTPPHGKKPVTPPAERPAKARTPAKDVIEEIDPFQPPKPTWEERLGPIGIAICAIVACAVAWLVTWKWF